MSVVEVEITDAVALVTINRPAARNALDPEVVVRLAEVWDDLRNTSEVRACVLTGAAGSTFCAGFDLASFVPLMTGSAPPTDAWGERVAADPLGLAAAATLRELDLGKPLVAAVNGHAIAGGLELLLAADIRILAAGARVSAGAVDRGLIPTMGGTARLARQVSPAMAAELLFTARPITAERALAAGLVNRVVPADQVVEAALDLARAIAANAPLAVGAAREIIRKARELDEPALLELERRRGEELAGTADAIEGPRAFLERRPAVFHGR